MHLEIANQSTAGRSTGPRITAVAARVHPRYTVATVATLIVIGVLLRLIDLRAPFLGDYGWNEAHYASIAVNFQWSGVLHQYDDFGLDFTTSPIVPWIMYASSSLFGISEASLRLPLVFFSIGSMLFFYLLLRALYGELVALVGLFFSAVMPGAIYNTHAIQLDGVAFTLGLAGLYALVGHRIYGGVWRLAAAGIALAACELVKLSFVLILPAALAVYTAGSSRLPSHTVRPVSALLFVLFVQIPAVCWLLISYVHQHDPGVYHSTDNYLIRTYQLHLSTFMHALATLLTYTPDLMSGILWYGAVISLPLALGLGLLSVRDLVIPLAVALPWYIQLVYPESWSRNHYYSFPAIFGYAALLSLMLTRALTVALEEKRQRNVLIATGTILMLVAVSCVSDYWYTYHTSYYSQINDTSASGTIHGLQALGRRAGNTQPILYDGAEAGYYIDYNRRLLLLADWSSTASLANVIKIVEAHQPAFIGFASPPPISLVLAIDTSGYVYLGGGAWELQP